MIWLKIEALMNKVQEYEPDIFQNILVQSISKELTFTNMHIISLENYLESNKVPKSL